MAMGAPLISKRKLAGSWDGVLGPGQIDRVGPGLGTASRVRGDDPPRPPGPVGPKTPVESVPTGDVKLGKMTPVELAGNEGELSIIRKYRPGVSGVKKG